MNRRLLLISSILLPWFLAFNLGAPDLVQKPEQISFEREADAHYSIPLTISERNGEVFVQWVSSGEESISHFMVERRDANTDFLSLGGTSLPIFGNVFEFQDMRQGRESNALYRLKIYFTDGSFVYTPAKMVRFKTRYPLTVTPQPYQSGFLVTLSHPMNGVLTITDLGGNIVHTRNWQGQASEIALDFLPSGLYIIRVTDGVQSWQAKVASFR
ncbi:MAG: T9SS type A sorting domain-containing protein [Bacteroidia bacterium]|nr:T9SS type A sorting domain-containing protein [Bacteroidia bacterium]